jgi:hypothetical protein
MRHTIAGQVLLIEERTVTVEQYTTVLHYSESKGTARLVLMAIADGRRAMQNLCAYANADEEEVKKAIDTLVSLRELRVSEHGDYQITLP